MDLNDLMNLPFNTLVYDKTPSFERIGQIKGSPFKNVRWVRILASSNNNENSGSIEEVYDNSSCENLKQIQELTFDDIIQLKNSTKIVFYREKQKQPFTGTVIAINNTTGMLFPANGQDFWFGENWMLNHDNHIYKFCSENNIEQTNSPYCICNGKGIEKQLFTSRYFECLICGKEKKQP